jgi:hypothetical protein
MTTLIIIVFVIAILILAIPVRNESNPVVKSMYVVLERDGKVVATSTLTFDSNFCCAQSPAGGNKNQLLPNFIGCYKNDIYLWKDLSRTEDEVRKVIVTYEE